jgi:hypothetical protein
VQARLDAAKNPLDPAFAEKGSILGLSPSTFSSIAGQFGAALMPKDSWQAKLGSIAAQMGSAKLAQMAKAEQEKRSADMFKQLVGSIGNKELASLSVGGAPAMKGLGLGGADKLQINPEFKVGG